MKSNIRFSAQIIFIGLLTSIILLACGTSEKGIYNDILYLRNQGSDLPIYVHGNSESDVMLLIVHGAGSYGLSFRDGAFKSTLEEKYAVAYFDHRGQSMSQGHGFATDNIVELMTQDLIQIQSVLKNKYGKKQFFLLGHSWGGALCTSALLNLSFQSRFNGWIHLDGVHDFPLAGSSRKGFLLDIIAEGIMRDINPASWEEIKTKLDPLDAFGEDDYSEILLLAQEVTSLLREEMVVESGIRQEKIINGVIKNNPINWLTFDFFNKPYIQARNENLSFADRMSDIRLPTLFIWGKYDVSVPLPVAYDAFERIGSEEKSMLIFDKSIHHPHDSEPEKFGEKIVDFIETYR